MLLISNILTTPTSAQEFFRACPNLYRWESLFRRIIRWRYARIATDPLCALFNDKHLNLTVVHWRWSERLLSFYKIFCGNSVALERETTLLDRNSFCLNRHSPVLPCLLLNKTECTDVNHYVAGLKHSNGADLSAKIFLCQFRPLLSRASLF